MHRKLIQQEILNNFELSLAPQIRLNSSKLLHKAFISEVNVLCLRSNMEVM